jgi:hypothetical protein
MSVDYRRTTTVSGAGTLAHNTVPKHFAAAQEINSLGAYCAWCIAEFNRTTTGHHPVRLSLPGVIDASPDLQANRLAGGFTADPAFAERTRPFWLRDVVGAVDKIVSVQQEQHHLGALNLTKLGSRSGHHPVGEVMVQRLHEKKPDLFTVVETTLPNVPSQRAAALTGFEYFQRWWEAGEIVITIMSDNDGPHPSAFKLAVTDQFQAKAMASFVAAPAQFKGNRNLAEVAKSLRQISPFAGMAFVSRNLQPFASRMQQLTWSLPGQRGNYDQRRLFWVEHVAHEAGLALRDALVQPEARAIAEDIHTSLPCFAMFTLPLEPTDQLAWEALTSELRQRIRATHPSVAPLFCAGPGTADPRYDGSTWLQVSLLFPLPPVPGVIERELRAQAKRTRRASSNAPTPLRLPAAFLPKPAVRPGPNIRRGKRPGTSPALPKEREA